MKQPIRAVVRATRCGVALPLDRAFRWYGASDKWLHGYGGPYRRHLSSLRRTRIRILEIGIGGYEARRLGGGSLRVWRDCFPRARIVGLDLHQKDVRLGARVSTVVGDQSSETDLARAIEELGGAPDVVIDDGSHLADHAIASFRYLFPRMPTGSVYVVEDLQTSYSALWGGDIPAPDNTAVGLAKDLIDAVQVRDPTFDRRPQDGPKPTHWADRVAALHVYPGIFFVERA